MTTRVYATLEIEGDEVVLRGETGSELAVVHKYGDTLAEATATDLVINLVHEMRSVEAERGE